MKQGRKTLLRSAARRTRLVRHRIFAGGAVLLGLGLLSSLAAAAPVYTDWTAPVNLGATVNSAVVPGSTGSDQGPMLSPDGLSLFFHSDRPGGFGGNDIWVSQRSTPASAWGVPANLGSTINSAGSDVVPALSSDRHWLFFASDRAGGFGLADIYGSYRSDVHNDFGWQTPTNLGANVNSAVTDNGNGYFDNGGHPQLFFGSNRPGGLGLSDLYMSELRADGSWGPATLIPGLNSAFEDNRPNIRQDGLELFFYSTRTGGFGGVDLWVATRATVDANWSPPVNLGATVNSASNELHPSLALDGRTLFFTSGRPGGSGVADLWMTTRDAVLTVTANGQTRLFGQPNPPLTYAFDGFVGGDTSAVVSGTAVCTTTATPSSPGGTYPITCTVGTLGAAGYVFAAFVPGTLTVAHTSPCLTGPRAGPLTVAAGQAICIGAGGTQTGPVTVMPGGSLDVEGGRIAGPVTSTGAASVRLCGATIAGPLTIGGSTGLVLVGGDAATGPCAANTIVGPVNVTGNTAGVELNGNTVIGPLRITGNTGSLPPPDTGPVHAVGNTVTGPVTIQP